MLLIAFISANYVDRSLRKYHVTEHFGLCGGVQPTEGVIWNSAVLKGWKRVCEYFERAFRGRGTFIRVVGVAGGLSALRGLSPSCPVRPVIA